MCGGITVCPGDLIMGDDDGVVVVPREGAGVISEKARAILEKERDIRTRALRRETIHDIVGLGRFLEVVGVMRG
jgi:regulator of RNase E activity RraA